MDYHLQFGQPWFLAALAILLPLAWVSWRNLAAIGPVRRVLALTLRCLVVALLLVILARPMLAQQGKQMTLIAVLDRSRSIPQIDSAGAGAAASPPTGASQPAADASPVSVPAYFDYLGKALPNKQSDDRLAVVEVAEAASISKLPTGDVKLRQRNTELSGLESRLSAGVEMALAIAPPNSGVRLLLASDGNQTAGDLRAAARVAAANHIPIDVLPARYRYAREVMMRNLVTPVKARTGQTVPLRMVLQSTFNARGRVELTDNGRPVDLDPNSPELSAPVELKAGTNVRTVSVPIETGGRHEFVARFLPETPDQDTLGQNNAASAITFVAGPGHVLVVDSDGTSSAAIARAIRAAKIEVQYCPAAEFPTKLSDLLDVDAIVLANCPCGDFTANQQDMLARYVERMGGGFIMTGGPNGFGAGGWIGSPVAAILPVDLDPKQKKQLPKGALVMVMHACEMEQGNFWGKQVALAAVKALSAQDLVGVLDYSWNANANAHWVYPLSAVGDRSLITTAINQMQMGDMPDFAAPMQAAYDALSAAKAGAKHVIIISDGDPSPPSVALLGKYKKAGITVSGVAIGWHSDQTMQNLYDIATATGGKFYSVKDPAKLPQIFIKEAQIVRRALIVEETVIPQVRTNLHQIMQGIAAVPQLDGYVLTDPKGGLAQVLLTAGKDGDPILAAEQVGLGRTVAFTGAINPQWGGSWLAWPEFASLWEQTIRWAGRPSQSSDCEIFADVQGQQVVVTVETTDERGKFLQMAHLAGAVIAPDMKLLDLPLTQVGPGRYRGQFDVSAGGSYMLNFQYRLAGAAANELRMVHSAVVVPYAPEFRDLSDNAALLAEVAEITGGRVLDANADPTRADLFSRAGVRFPQSAMPLTNLLLCIWAGLFLLDVAARRLVIDFVGMARQAKALLPGRKTKPVAQEQTLQRLKDVKTRRLEELRSRGKLAPAARTRFEAPAGSSAQLPQAAAPKPPPASTVAPAPTKPPAEPKKEGSSLSQLLEAKKRAQDKMKRDNPP